MGAAGNLSGMKTRNMGFNGRQRPFFIDEANWDIFLRFVVEGHAVPEIAAARQCSVSYVRKVLHEVDNQLKLPRHSEREWSQVTPNSPIEDLSLSVRALNQLHDLGCATVEDV